MSDCCDDSDKKIEDAINEGVENASRIAQAIPVGNPGDCDFCNEWSGRLVRGVCAPCRDRYRIG